MMNQITQCPVCDSSEFSTALEGVDYGYTQEEFTIVSCTSCGFWFTNPIPTEDKIGDYYKSENYISHTSSKKGLFERLYHIVRKRAIKQKFKLSSRGKSQGHLLDIGCGTGDFLLFASQNWKVKGLEPSDDARKLAADKGVDVSPATDLHSLEANTFDSITMWHVLEHVYDLNKDLAQIKNVLKDDGYLYVAVPNRTSFDAKHYQKYWAAYDLPIHLYHFAPADIKTLMKKHGMEVEKVLPMKFDSYYVSMLSEQYKNQHKKLSIGDIIKGFWNGFRSNMKANNETYSSQIYVIKKAA
ncbi:class I SAM-dependent methyltransferase [Paracrocinitomix mangrovi]|uniref:class I SAM-dependent methyltransferase n=1 Tax=Paracrocinitomix mangrovi TaxID=2862509 RepID=UPI001C8F1644|nr:class I SAM-dependent methyltransferase [Paracrocinitomix mangrovi]UKN00474.1 class I SAM-dependent methyltransferase [Paracrocinitomix mangrovi]